jgi:hypothetical protein
MFTPTKEQLDMLTKKELIANGKYFENSFEFLGECEEKLFKDGLLDLSNNIFLDSVSNKFIIHNHVTGDIKYLAQQNVHRHLKPYYHKHFKLDKNIADDIPACTRKFLPNDKAINADNDRTTYNTFTKNKYMEQNETLDKLDWNKFPNIGLLYRNVFGEYRDDFVNWLAFGLRYREKSTVSWVSKTAHGAGKGAIYEKTIKPLFGNYAKSVDNEQLKSRFNGWQNEALFVCANEITVDFNEKTRDNDRLKAYITDKEAQIENKGVNAVMAETFYNMWILSNSDNPITIEDGDRRFTVIEQNTPLEKVVEDRNAFFKEVEKEVEAFCEAVGSLKVDITKARTAIMTKAKKKIVEANKTNTELMLDMIDNNKLDEIMDAVEEYNEAHRGSQFELDESQIEKELTNGYLSPVVKQGLYKALVGVNASTRQIAKIFNIKYGKPIQKKINGVNCKRTRINPLYQIEIED